MKEEYLAKSWIPVILNFEATSRLIYFFFQIDLKINSKILASWIPGFPSYFRPYILLIKRN